MPIAIGDDDDDVVGVLQASTRVKQRVLWQSAEEHKQGSFANRHARFNILESSIWELPPTVPMKVERVSPHVPSRDSKV